MTRSLEHHERAAIEFRRRHGCHPFELPERVLEWCDILADARGTTELPVRSRDRRRNLTARNPTRDNIVDRVLEFVRDRLADGRIINRTELVDLSPGSADTTARVLRALERHGHLERTSDRRDRRCIEYRLKERA